MQSISVCVLTFNEAANIEHALRSVRHAPWCAEILVFDSGSTDHTVTIARRFADRVEHHPWVNFNANRQAIVRAATHDRVLILDADEEVSPELIQAIGQLTDDHWRRSPIFTFPRRNFLFGRHVRAWGPDRVDRLFDRKRVTWCDHCVHDRRYPVMGHIGKLHTPLLHRPRIDNWGDYFEGARYETRIDEMAQQMYDRGKRAKWHHLWVRPATTFFKYFVLKAGFTQGTFGMLVARKAACSVALKYARLWHLQQAAQREQAQTARFTDDQTVRSSLARTSPAAVAHSVPA